MAWTYNDALTVDRDKVRLLIGDTDTTRPLYQDDEMDYFVTNGGSILESAADALEAAAAKFSRDFDFSADGTIIKKSTIAKALAARAQKLREAAARVTGYVDLIRVDGHSDDISVLDRDETNASLTFDVGRWDEVGKNVFGFIR